MSVRRLLSWILVVALGLLAWLWHQHHLGGVLRRDVATIGTATHQLSGLRVDDSRAPPGYDRTTFAWRDDVDGNGCDTRDDVLARDLTAVRTAPEDRCRVLSGSLVSPYSGEEVTFHRGSRTIEIDHVVALSQAWRSGAHRWDHARRRAFANDPVNLLAVERRLNQDKGDADAAAWLPPAPHLRCGYVARQIAVKARWDLSVTTSERVAMADALARCPGFPATDPRESEWLTEQVSRGRR